MTLQMFRDRGVATRCGDRGGRGAVVHFGGGICAFADKKLAQLGIAARRGQVKRGDAAAAAGGDAGATVDQHFHKDWVGLPCQRGVKGIISHLIF